MTSTLRVASVRCTVNVGTKIVVVILMMCYCLNASHDFSVNHILHKPL